MLNYIYRLILIISILFHPNVMHAQTWINASMENNRTVFIDLDSITSNNDSIYYNVKYYNKNGEEISTVQSQGSKIGIVSTYKSSEYKENNNPANTFVNPVSITLNEISIKSFLYNANEIAKYTNFRKTHIPNKISHNIKTKKHSDYLIDEYKSSLTHPFSFNTGKIDISKENQFVSFSKPYNTETNKIETGELAKAFEVYQNKLYQVWTKLIQKGNFTKKTVVLITFYKNGELVSCLLKKSSGDDDADEAAIKAVRQVGNFVELPANYKDDYLDINFSFSYRGMEIH